MKMSLRSVWIISVSHNDPSQVQQNGRLLFARTFPIVEKKAKIADGVSYVPLPNSIEFVSGLLFELGYNDDVNKFIQARDTCRKLEKKPVFEVTTSCGVLWPVIVVEQRGLLYCCLPLVEQGIGSKPALIEIPGVTIGFSLLCGLVDFLRQVPASEVPQRTTELHQYLSIAAPFGSPTDVNPETVISKMYNRPSYVPKTQKFLPLDGLFKQDRLYFQQPAWKPVLHKGKNSVSLAITEFIKAAQYNKEGVPDVWDLYGKVSCKAELEGALPDITLNISHVIDGITLPLNHLLIHPCVQSADAAILDKASSEAYRPAPRRMRFTPPSETFTLCHYTITTLKELPIKALYEMKMDGRVAKLNVQLCLQEKMKNLFDYCELQIPFFNRGVISTFDATATQGNTMLSPDRRILVWNIGQRFSSKSLSAGLDATVNFTDGKQGNYYEDPFCVGDNSYAQLFFKIPEFTHSGCYIDPKSVQVSPNIKFKLTTALEYLSVEYKIWNCNGDALTSVVPKSLLQYTESLPDSS